MLHNKQRIENLKEGAYQEMFGTTKPTFIKLPEILQKVYDEMLNKEENIGNLVVIIEDM